MFSNATFIEREIFWGKFQTQLGILEYRLQLNKSLNFDFFGQ